jgi:hypothetical protein
LLSSQIFKDAAPESAIPGVEVNVSVKNFSDLTELVGKPAVLQAATREPEQLF